MGDFSSSSELSLAEITTSLLLDELRRRDETEFKPICGSGKQKGAYNTSSHVFALFLILILSTLACAFPIIVRRIPGIHIPHHFLFLSRHFGTGVLIATAFVHLLPTAFVSLTDPCLPRFWNRGYKPMAGLIAMVSVLVVVGIEMFFATRGAGHVHSSEYGTVPEGNEAGSSEAVGLMHTHRREPSASVLHSADEFSIAQPSPLPPEVVRKQYTDDDDEEESDLELNAEELAGNTPTINHGIVSSDNLAPTAHFPPKSSRHRHSLSFPHPLDRQQEQKMLLQVLLLEAGILFHSVFIGMALSVATGTSFVVLLVAISFHQTFEGLALGARIASISSFSKDSVKPWLMALAYGTTTPIGQAIGLMVHNLYDPASQTGLLMVGVMNSISSGLLLFAGLVELLAEDFLSDKSYETLKGKRRLEACASVVAGAMLMATVGAFA